MKKDTAASFVTALGASLLSLVLPACVGAEAIPSPAADAGSDATISPGNGADAASDAAVGSQGDDAGPKGNDSGLDSGTGPVADAGSDSNTGPVADADADAGDSGPGVDANTPAPTVSLVSPNLGASVGGWKVTITGSNFVKGAGVVINGSACKNVVWVSSTTLTATTPAYSTPNGSTNAQTVTVTNPDHASGTGGGVAGSYFYLPSNSPIVMFQRGDVGITVSTFVSGWTDQSGNGNDWSQPTVANQPGAGTNYNSTGLGYLTFNGTSDFMTNTFVSPISSGIASMFVVGNFTLTTSANPVAPLFLGGSGATDLYLQGPSAGSEGVFVGNTSSALTAGATPDTKPHVFTAIGNGTGSLIQVDSTVAGTGDLGAADLSTLNGLGADQRGGAHYFAPMDVMLVLVIDGGLSAADVATVQAILKATSNTP
jgi:hypothetical protein